MHHVRADLFDLRGAERAARDLERGHLLLAEQRTAFACEGLIADRADLGDAREVALAEHGRLVRAFDQRPRVEQRELARRERLLGALKVGAARTLALQVDLLLEQLDLGRLQCELEPRADRVALVRVELLGLHQHLLAHADLAEVVEQRRVLELLQIAAAEADVGERPVAHRADALGQAAREHADAARVAAGGRVALLDRLHARAHEALEDALDLVVKERVLERDPGLRRERRKQLFAARVETDDRRARTRRPARAAAGPAARASC